jgi:tRNA(Arg) A34 adenosine deaminase TadA
MHFVRLVVFAIISRLNFCQAQFLLDCIAYQFHVSIQLSPHNPMFENVQENTLHHELVTAKFMPSSLASDEDGDWTLPPTTSWRSENMPVLHLFWDSEYKQFLCLGLSGHVEQKNHAGEEDKIVKATWLQLTEKLFDYPQSFERFYAVLKAARLSTLKKGREGAFEKDLRSSVYTMFVSSRARPGTETSRSATLQLIPIHKVFFKNELKKEALVLSAHADAGDDARKRKQDRNDDSSNTISKLNVRPLEIFQNWFQGHWKKCCHLNSHCLCLKTITNFIARAELSFFKMSRWMQLLCAFSHHEMFHFSSMLPLTDLDKSMHVCVQHAGSYAYSKIGDIMEASDVNDKTSLRAAESISTFPDSSKQLLQLIFCRDLDSSVCIFEDDDSQTQAMFDLVGSDFPMSLKTFLIMQKHISTMTARWLRRQSGQNMWAHMPKLEYEPCVTEKCTNVGQKWRHLIYSYAVMALLWNEYNGNKEGPLGVYSSRSAQVIGTVNGGANDGNNVYGSKQYGVPVDYVGHNVVALAVGKRGDILRIAYNHNTLFSSTVDHAEERLIDGLYRDPAAFVQKSHARIHVGFQKLDIEKHMQHISVYTSLEPCQQCAGKMHLALVPEVVSCQRDWDIKLLGGQLYNQFHKCRAVLASHFDFSPYDDLSRSYDTFCKTHHQMQPFFKSRHRETPSKDTMPYFLCTDEAHDIFKRGHYVFDNLFSVLFQENSESRSALKNKYQLDLLNLYNLDISEWLQSEDEILRFRPSLDDKKKRIDHDELLCTRQHWVSSVFNQMCSLTFSFDPNSVVDEQMIEKMISPLGDISVINLSRDNQGLLIGSFVVTFVDSKSAKFVKETFDKMVWDETGCSDFQPGFGSFLCNREKFFAASNWLYSIRTAYPFEVFVPSNCHDGVLKILKTQKIPFVPMWACSAGMPSQDFERHSEMWRRWPLLGTEMPIIVLRCADSACAKRLKRLLPNFDATNNMRVRCESGELNGVTVSISEKSSTTHRPDGKLDGCSISMIARSDVTEAQLLKYLGKCVSQRRSQTMKRLFPKFSRLSPSTLSTCNSKKGKSETLKWLYIPDKQCYHWKIWQIQFTSSDVTFNEEEFKSILQKPLLTELKLEERHTISHQFCQPYPQSVFDYAFFLESSSLCLGFRVPFRLHCDWIKVKDKINKPEKDKKDMPQRVFRFYLIILLDRGAREVEGTDVNEGEDGRTPTDTKHSGDSDHKEENKEARDDEEDKKEEEDLRKKVGIRIDVSTKLDSQEENKTYDFHFSLGHPQRKEDNFRIDIRESSLVTLLCSNMLFDHTDDIESLLKYLKENPHWRPDFWGNSIKILKPKKKNKVKKGSEGIIDPYAADFPRICLQSLRSIRDKNLLQLDLQSQDDKIRLNLDFSKESRNQFFCQYCGIYSEFCCRIYDKDKDRSSYNIVRAQCIDHTSNRAHPPAITYCPKVYLGNGDGWKKVSDRDKERSETQVESTKDSQVRKFVDKIRQLEKDLRLQLSAESMCFPWVLQSESQSESVIQLGSVSLLLRRDEFYGPAHILFCLYVPGREICSASDFKIEIAIPGKYPFFSSNVQETQRLQQRMYGRLSADKESPDRVSPTRTKFENNPHRSPDVNAHGMHSFTDGLPYENDMTTILLSIASCCPQFRMSPERLPQGIESLFSLTHGSKSLQFIEIDNGMSYRPFFSRESSSCNASQLEMVLRTPALCETNRCFFIHLGIGLELHPVALQAIFRKHSSLLLEHVGDLLTRKKNEDDTQFDPLVIFERSLQSVLCYGGMIEAPILGIVWPQEFQVARACISATVKRDTLSLPPPPPTPTVCRTFAYSF